MIDVVTIAELSGLLGAGAVIKSVIDSVLGRKRERTDLAKMSVEITASVMSSMRVELDDTRKQLTETRVALDRAHEEIADLRTALTNALRELATYRTTTTTVSTTPVFAPGGIIPNPGESR